MRYGVVRVATEDEQMFEVTNDTRWAYYLDVNSFETVKVTKEIPMSAVLMKGNVTNMTHNNIGTPLHEHPDIRYFVPSTHELVEYHVDDVVAYIKPHLVRFMVEQNLLPPNSKIKSTSKPLTIRTASMADGFYIGFDIPLLKEDVPGLPIDFALGLTKMGDGSGWRLEKSPSGRASCNICKRTISKGSLRFVKEVEIYYSSTLKRHPSCMKPRSFGYMDPRRIGMFDKLDLSERDRILGGIMGWRVPLIISDQAYSAIRKDDRFHKQNSILSRMDIGVDLLDSDILFELRACYQENDFHKYRSDVSAIARTVLKDQLDNGGSTLFLDTDKMRPWAEFASLIPAILELRKAEMEKCVVSKVGDSYDLRALWLTHWGFKLLSLSKLWLTASAKTIARVKELMTSAGFELNIQETDTTPIHVKMSDNMRTFIWSHGRSHKKTLSKFILTYT